MHRKLPNTTNGTPHAPLCAITRAIIEAVTCGQRPPLTVAGKHQKMHRNVRLDESDTDLVKMCRKTVENAVNRASSELGAVVLVRLLWRTFSLSSWFRAQTGRDIADPPSVSLLWPSSRGHNLFFFQ